MALQSHNGILAVVGDLHTVSTVGLSPPSIELDDGGTHRANAFQRWLWRNWKAYWKRIEQLSEDLRLPVTAVIMGDTIDGDHHGTYSIIMKNPATMLRLAARVLEPTLEVVENIFILRGTPAHEGNEAWLADKLAEDIGAVPCNGNRWSWWHLRLLIGGVLFDLAHHPESGSIRPWTRGGGANRTAAIITYDYAGSRDRIPDVAIRAHRHTWEDSGTNHPVRVFFAPAWQGPTDFIHRIGGGAKLPLFGGMYFVCRDGEYCWDRITFRPKRAAPEVV